MNNEQKQIIDDAYKNYCNAYPDVEKTFQYEGSNIEVRRMTQEDFIEQIKTDNGFANTWGLKIEERELSGEERWELLRKRVGDDIFKNWVSEIVPFGGGLSEYLQSNIPTKLITITYKDSIIESYEN